MSAVLKSGWAGRWCPKTSSTIIRQWRAPNGYYHAGPKRKPIPDAACMPQRAPLARPLQGGCTIATTASAGAAHPP